MGKPTDTQFTSLCHCFPYIICLQSDQLGKHGSNSKEQGTVCGHFMSNSSEEGKQRQKKEDPH